MKISNKTDKYSKIYKKLALNRKKNGHFKTKGKIFASWAGRKCEQSMRYDFEGIEKKPDIIWPYYEARIGDAIHAEIQKDFSYAFKDKVEVESFLRTKIMDVRINPKIDMIMNNKVWEIKTVKDSEDMPRDKDLYQANFYMGISSMHKGILSYFNRSRGKHLATFELDFDEEMYNEVIEKFTRIINNDSLNKDEGECYFCNYKYLCKEGGE